MEFLGHTHYGPQNYINDLLRDDYKEPMNAEDAQHIMENTERTSTCPNKIGRPDFNVIRNIDCYTGRVNGFAYGSKLRFNKMKRKGVIHPTGPTDIFRILPTTSMDAQRKQKKARHEYGEAKKFRAVAVKMEEDAAVAMRKLRTTTDVEMKNTTSKSEPVIKKNKDSHCVVEAVNKMIEKVSQERSSEKIKELILKDATLNLIIHSNLTLFDWFKNKFRCYFCKELFFDSTALKDHAKTHAVSEISEKINRFNNKYYYRAEITDLKCSDCQKSCEDIKELTEHLVSAHKVDFKTKESLLMPFRLKEFTCQLCKLEIKSFVMLDHHMTTHFSKFMCDTCGKGFRQKQGLKTHMTNSHQKRIFKCKICDLNFESQYKKYRHCVAAHNGAYTNICPHCPEKFGNHIARLLHLVNKHGHKKPEFKCTHCNKIYITNALLRSHVRNVHMQERNYECDVCGNKYMRKCELTDHMKSHIQARDFVCTYCGKAFFRRRNLNEHLAIHVESYRHECPICKKTFAQKYNMKMHRKRCQELQKK